MSIAMQSTKRPTKRYPKVIINADDLAHLEGLADGMMRRQPALADRLFDEIGRARIVAPSKMPKNVVGMGQHGNLPR